MEWGRERGVTEHMYRIAQNPGPDAEFQESAAYNETESTKEIYTLLVVRCYGVHALRKILLKVGN